jgi:hypothetical protein
MSTPSRDTYVAFDIRVKRTLYAMAQKQSSRPKSAAMKATTVRFGEDLWALLADEAARSGVSVSQYIREAALARAAFAAGRRAELPGELFASWAESALSAEAGEAEKRVAVDGLIAALARARSRHEAAELKRVSAETASETAALIEQARLTAKRAREIRRAARGDGE